MWCAQADIDFQTPPWPSISQAAKDCVRQLLNVAPDSRPTASKLLQVCQQLPIFCRSPFRAQSLMMPVLALANCRVRCTHICTICNIAEPCFVRLAILIDDVIGDILGDVICARSTHG